MNEVFVLSIAKNVPGTSKKYPGSEVFLCLCEARVSAACSYLG
jgi:hypothetical protein